MSANSFQATGEEGQLYLFAKEKLSSLSEWNVITKKLMQSNLTARPLKLADYDGGYLELLSQLTQVGQVSKDEFQNRFEAMRQINLVEDHYAIVVIEDITTSRIVATSTLFLEYKFIHNCAVRGRLEDVAVIDTYRGKSIGELVVKIIVGLAREIYNCYKLTLDCRDELKKFYARNDFTYASIMLAIKFKE